ncbi:MAG TPA: universal stress protein [Ignavibacteriaceae bacterium]|jgi:nucleotide-binding universal stress UspA family protein|nr:universal stress protein [Ignavibacteriaceae bacterium]HPO56994.1 universal stress protein [Ignavibacteriaceae bacterium]
MTIKKILVPIDFSESSIVSLRYALEFIRLFQAKLCIIYVLEPVVYPPDFSLGQISLPSVDLEMDKRAREELQKIAKNEIPEGIEYELIIKSGKPFVEIIEAAQNMDIDLIIIATHGHSGVEHILFGSTAEKVVRKAPCPVLSVRKSIKGFDVKTEIKKG